MAGGWFTALDKMLHHEGTFQWNYCMCPYNNSYFCMNYFLYNS
jgi:hypothetical protein